MGGNRLLSLIVVVVLVGVAAYLLIPGVRTKVDETVKGLTSWDAEARRKDPEGFIKYAQGQLTKNIDKFEALRGTLRASSVKLEKEKTTHQAKLAFADKELEGFKTAYKGAKASNTWPVTVAGRPYKEAELRSQVALLLSQRTGFESVVKQMDIGLTQAESKGLELINQISESKAKLSILGAQLELVKLNRLTAESEKLLSEVNDVLLENEALAEKPAVRTVEELMKDAGASPAGGSAAVDSFLNG
jgi:hypothetical protein